MLVITRATTNTIYPTLKEKGVLTSPSYVIKFISDFKGSGDARYCVCTDASTYPDRYQQLTVVETTSPTQISNQVKLDNSLSWKYTIYECTAAYIATLTNWTQFSSSGLTTVEIGRVKVINSSTTTPQTYTGYQTTYKEHAG